MILRRHHGLITCVRESDMTFKASALRSCLPDGLQMWLTYWGQAQPHADH